MWPTIVFACLGVITSAQTLPTTPRIRNVDGVVNAATFTSDISSGAWATIFGTNLAPNTVVARTWAASDIVGSHLPTVLDGVRVNFREIPAAIAYISSTQLNIQVPDGLAPGEYDVEVINSRGSATAKCRISRFSPGFFVGPSTVRISYVAGVLGSLDAENLPTYVGRSELLSGVRARTARPGDIISIYGTGFGATNPQQLAGRVILAAPLSNSVRVSVGQKNVDVLYAGLTGPGLNQINISVPDLPDGDYPITANIEGTSTQPDLYLTIRQSTPKPDFILFTNATDSLLLQGTAPTGERLKYYGTKNSEGYATSVTGFSVEKPSGDLTMYGFDAQGRLGQISTSNGVVFNLAWNSNRTVTISATDPTGLTSTVRVPVPSIPSISSKINGRNERAIQTPKGAGGTGYVPIKVSRCGLPVDNASVWITVRYPGRESTSDIFRALHFQNGDYVVSIPTPDPLAGSNVTEKCVLACDVLDFGCEVIAADPMLPLRACTIIATATRSPHVTAVCIGAFAGLAMFCETLGGGPTGGPGVLTDYVCPAIGSGIDRYLNLPLDITVTANGRPSGSAFGVPPTGPFPSFDIRLQCDSVTLFVVRAGPGGGVVNVFPSSIICGSVCSDTFNVTTGPVPLIVAARPDPDSEFSHWSGECSGQSPNARLVLSGNTSKQVACTANFNRRPACPMTGSWFDQWGHAYSIIESNGNLSSGVTAMCNGNTESFAITGNRIENHYWLTGTNLNRRFCVSSFSFTGTLQCNSASGTWTNSFGWNGLIWLSKW